MEIRDEFEMVLKLRKLKTMYNAKFMSIRDKYFLKQAEVEVMIYLNAKDGATSRRIAEDLQLQKGHVSLAKDCLVKKGFVTAQRNEKDRRYELLELTDAGREVCEELKTIKHELESQLFAGFCDEDKELFRALFTRMMDNVNDDVTFQEQQLRTGLLGKQRFVEMMDARRKVSVFA